MDFHRGLVRAYDATTHTAAVLLAGSMSRVLLGVPVAQHIGPHLMQVGATCAVAFFADGSHALVLAIMDGQALIPGCRVTGTQTYAYNVFAAAAFTAENWDPLSMHHNVTNNTRLIAKIAGKYHVSAGMSWGATSGGLRIIQVRHGAATIIAEDRRTGFPWVCNTISADYHFALDEYATIWGYTDSTAQAADAWASMTRTGP